MKEQSSHPVTLCHNILLNYLTNHFTVTTRPNPSDKPVLQNVQTDPSIRIHIWMKHLADESDCGRFVWILLRELYRQFEGAVLEGRVVRAEYHRVPQHDVVITGGT